MQHVQYVLANMGLQCHVLHILAHLDTPPMSKAAITISYGRASARDADMQRAKLVERNHNLGRAQYTSKSVLSDK